MIMLKNTGSEIFDEAYFILKEERMLKGDVSENDMVREASRIVNDNLLSVCYKKGAPTAVRDKLKTLFWYAVGALSGAAFVCLMV